MLEFIRSVLWFENGELGAIWAKLTTGKPTYEARWEADVLGVIFVGAGIAFWVDGWLVWFSCGSPRMRCRR